MCACVCVSNLLYIVHLGKFEVLVHHGHMSLDLEVRCSISSLVKTQFKKNMNQQTGQNHHESRLGSELKMRFCLHPAKKFNKTKEGKFKTDAGKQPTVS